MTKKLSVKSLYGVIPPVAERHVSDITDVVISQDQRLSSLEGAGFITASQLPTVQYVNSQLKSSGSSPLNVTGLLGVLSQPQTPYLQTVTSLPPINSPLAQNGVVVIYNNALYYFSATPIPGQWLPVPTLAVALFGSHATRITIPASSYPVGTIYYEIDRTVWYINQSISSVQQWVYSTGEFSCTQANLPADLSTYDQGFISGVRDYNHKLLWGKTRDQAYSAGWGWAPGEPGDSGKISGFLIDPTSVGWHVCDGASVNYLKSDGTLGGPITLPNTQATAAYLKYSTPASATINTAVAPTFNGSALAAHSHELPLQNVSGTVQRFLPSATFGTGTSRAAASVVTTTADSTSAAVALSQSITAGTPAGTITATAEPSNLVLKAWFRQ